MDRKRVRMKISLSDWHTAHLDRMAADAGVLPAALARSMIEAILDDDARAHAMAAAANSEAA